MANLGELGVPKVAHETTFGWFGAELHVHPQLTDLLLMDFAEEAQKMDENSPEVLSFLKKQIRIIVAPTDFDAFWSAAVENGLDSTDLMGVMKTLVEAHAKRPTVQPSDSLDGQKRTGDTSPGGSSSPDAPDSPLTDMDRRAIENEAGRPDVAMTIWNAAKQRQMERRAG